MTFMLFLAQNWKDTVLVNRITGIVGNKTYNNLTKKQIERLISILTD